MVDVYLSAREIDSYIAIFRRKQIVRRTSSCATSCLITILWTKILSMTIGKNFNKKGGYNGNFISNNLKTERTPIRNAIKVARECRVENEE